MNDSETKSIMPNQIWWAPVGIRKWARAFRARYPHDRFWHKLLVCWCAWPECHCNKEESPLGYYKKARPMHYFFLFVELFKKKSFFFAGFVAYWISWHWYLSYLGSPCNVCTEALSVGYRRTGSYTQKTCRSTYKFRICKPAGMPMVHS